MLQEPIKIEMPEFMGTRILMMPIMLENVGGSLPSEIRRWTHVIEAMRLVFSGIGYITIDERAVGAGTTHRRPGLHVDGWQDDSDDGAWGGGGWGKFGWSTLASHVGCAVYGQVFKGSPGPYGDCEHLRPECGRKEALKAGYIYFLESLTVHESVPMTKSVNRQFVRLSMPSDAGWPISNTPNPFGILPAGKLLPPRPKRFTDYKPLNYEYYRKDSIGR